MGPIELAVREHVKASKRLLTPSQGKTFTVETVDDAGVVLLLGEKQTRTPIRWSVLEGVGTMLADSSWVPIGGVYDTTAISGTLDAYLKRFIKRVTAGGWPRCSRELVWCRVTEAAHPECDCASPLLCKVAS